MELPGSIAPCRSAIPFRVYIHSCGQHPACRDRRRIRPISQNTTKILLKTTFRIRLRRPGRLDRIAMPGEQAPLAGRRHQSPASSPISGGNSHHLPPGDPGTYSAHKQLMVRHHLFNRKMGPHHASPGFPSSPNAVCGKLSIPGGHDGGKIYIVASPVWNSTYRGG